MIGAPNSLNLICKVRVMKEALGPLVSEDIADIFTNYNIDLRCPVLKHGSPKMISKVNKQINPKRV